MWIHRISILLHRSIETQGRTLHRSRVVVLETKAKGDITPIVLVDLISKSRVIFLICIHGFCTRDRHEDEFVVNGRDSEC